MSRYEPGSYWSRLHRRGDLSAVGQSGLPASTNRWLYATLARELGRFATIHSLAPTEIFEVGAGTGYWVDWWTKRGARVFGGDLVPEAVDGLRSRYGERFDVLDISLGAPARTAQLVLVMNVLLHVTDDQAFARSLTNVALAVEPGGHLLMVEPIQRSGRYPRSYPAGASSKARPQQAYLAPLLAAGLELVSLEPATALGADPIEARSRKFLSLETLAWRILKSPAKVGLGELAGRLIYFLDPVALRLGAGYASKVLLMRRPLPDSASNGSKSRGAVERVPTEAGEPRRAGEGDSR
jgi:2-polyprenyl-3-methyl-5-hydroxy-6-metoxy-1,4-benzoquinol methylase